MKKQVLTSLQLNADQYYKLVLDLYFNWCCTKAKNRKSLQKVLTCTPLFNWWYKQLSELEKDFVDQVKDYQFQLDPETARSFYNQSVDGIYQLFSKPLIKLAHDA
ncbi:hypothetical protein [Formosa sp. S-31]|uniref:hypothetical protein n=1 Tax=Formosa sp. S-31 TaxID=2790949 RepID=UPI003EB986CD